MNKETTEAVAEVTLEKLNEHVGTDERGIMAHDFSAEDTAVEIAKASIKAYKETPEYAQEKQESFNAGKAYGDFYNWRDIETAPKDGVRIIGFVRTNVPKGNWHTGILSWNKYCEEWDRSDYGNFPDPTHWMPLPTPPEEK